MTEHPPSNAPTTHSAGPIRDTRAPHDRQNRPRRGRGLVISIAILGGFVLLLFGAVAVVSAIDLARSPTSANLTADTTGVTEIDVNISAAAFTLRFDEVNEAVLAATGSHSDRWQLTTNDGQLRVTQAPAGLLGVCLGWCQPNDQRVELTLPRELEGLRPDTGIDMSAGSVTATGSFGALDVNISAGSATLDGSAEQLTVDMSAGRLDARLSDVADARFDVSAGRIMSTLTGSAPRQVMLDVSAGSIDLTLPDVEYRVDSSVSAGGFDNLLRTRSSSAHAISADVSAGSITLRPGR